MIESAETNVSGPDAAWLDAALPEDVRTVALIGTSDRTIDALEARRPGIRIVAFEPDPSVARALAARHSSTANRVAIVSGPDYPGAADIARRFADLHRSPTIVHPQLTATRPADVERARTALARVTFQTSANEGARRAASGRYLLHTLSNVTRIARESNVSALAGLTSGMPAIIAAAGPSLDRNIHDLAPARDRAVLISCDTAAWPLLSVGIAPDFIVGADPSRVNAGHLASLPSSRSWLVAEGSLHPSAFVNFDRRTFIFNVSNHQPWPWLGELGLARATLGTWGSVATSAFSLALMMGCDPIVFVGADFAFTGGRPYCRGTSFEPQWSMWVAGGGAYPGIWQTLVDRWPAVTECDLHGQPARTARHLVSFRDWVVERAQATGRRIVNATGAGLLFGDGIEQDAAYPLLYNNAPLPADLLHDAIRAAHASAQGDVARTLRGVDVMLEQDDNPVRDAWIAATDHTVSGTAISAALRSPEHKAWSLAMGCAKDLS